MKTQYLSQVRKLLSFQDCELMLSEGCYCLLKKTLQLNLKILSLIDSQKVDLENSVNVFLKKRKNLICSILQMDLTEKEKKLVIKFFMSSDKIFKEILAKMLFKNQGQANEAYKWKRVIKHYGQSHSEI